MKTELCKLEYLDSEDTDGFETFYCPHCNDYFRGSYYLERIFKHKPRTKWLANFITHYRHNHTKWDEGRYKLNGNKVNYEKSKVLMNEYIKQLLIRKYSQFLKENEIKLEIFKNLKNTTNETINLYKRTLREVMPNEGLELNRS